MNRHWPVLALGAVSMATAIGLAFWRLSGGPNLFPIPAFLALMGTLTLSLWVRFVQRERKRFFENWSRNRLRALSLVHQSQISKRYPPGCTCIRGALTDNPSCPHHRDGGLL